MTVIVERNRILTDDRNHFTNNVLVRNPAQEMDPAKRPSTLECLSDDWLVLLC